MQASWSEDAVTRLKEATELIRFDLDGASGKCTSHLSHISQCMERTVLVKNEPLKDLFGFTGSVRT